MQDITALYILGDLFDTWLGDDLIPNEFSDFIKQLRQLKRYGVKTYLMVGNHDFMLGQNFAQHCGCLFLKDPVVVNLHDQQILLMHGDSLCVDDIAYQSYRRWSRNRILRWCFLRLPTRCRQSISDEMKQKNLEQKQHKTDFRS